MSEWTIEYGNCTGDNDNYFWEWWDVSNGVKHFKATEEEYAIWLHELLNNQEDEGQPSDHVAREPSEILRMIPFKRCDKEEYTYESKTPLSP